MKDSHDVGPVCSRFVQGDDMVVAEHYDVSSGRMACDVRHNSEQWRTSLVTKSHHPCK